MCPAPAGAPPCVAPQAGHWHKRDDAVSDEKSGFGGKGGGPKKPQATFGDVMLGIPSGARDRDGGGRGPRRERGGGGDRPPRGDRRGRDDRGERRAEPQATPEGAEGAAPPTAPASAEGAPAEGGGQAAP